MDRKERLAKKTIIYAIGNFGSKLLSFLLVPYYTYKIPAEEYGVYDLIITAISLLIPLVTMQTAEAIIAGMIDGKKDKNKIIKSTILIIIFNSLIIIPLLFIFAHYKPIPYLPYVGCLLIIKSLFTVIQQQCRGLSNSSLYALSGIIYTLVFLLLNIFNLSVLNIGISGLLLSDILACLISTIIILIFEKRIIRSISCKIDKEFYCWIVKFSMPLIPNAIGWWVINASDRYVIRAFLDSSANGIYAISYKLASIIVVITSLFNLAWQEVSLEEYGSNDKEVFYSRTFNAYMRILLCSAIICISVTKPIVDLFISQQYNASWKYSGLLYLATVFSALASFLNTGYLANSKTNEIFRGTVMAAVINLSIDILLIKHIGLYAASLSTFVASFALFIRRVFNSRDMYQLQIDWKQLLTLTFIGVFLSCFYIFFDNRVLMLIILLVSVLGSIFLNRELINGIVKKILRVVRRA